jgi:hypothetical protein
MLKNLRIISSLFLIGLHHGTTLITDWNPSDARCGCCKRSSSTRFVQYLFRKKKSCSAAMATHSAITFATYYVTMRKAAWSKHKVDCVWNVMAHAQKPDCVSRRNGRVHLNQRWGGGEGDHFSRLLAGELCTSDCRVCTARASLWFAVMWRLQVTHSILLFPLHFSSRASPCSITFQTQSIV